MTITNGYCTLDELKHKARLMIESSDSGYDEMLEGVIEDASREIDNICHRYFYTDADSDDPEVRYFTALSPNQLFVDDIRTATGLEIAIDQNEDGVIDTTLTTADYVLEPANAIALGEPYQKISLRPTSTWFPKGVLNGVRVTAHYGWSAVPRPINQKTLLWAERLYKRFATPIGSESMTALGKQILSIPAEDGDIKAGISRYIKPVWG